MEPAPPDDAPQQADDAAVVVAEALPPGPAAADAEASTNKTADPESSEAERLARLAELRTAFSHLDTPDAYITSQLLPAQAAALAAYRSAAGLAAKAHWALPELAAAGATAEELKLVEAMRDRLVSQHALATPEDAAYASDLMLLRYVRARDHHLDKAYHMLLATLAWRRTARPHALANPATAANKASSDARIVGWDVQGRVVVYSSFAKSLQRTPEHVKVNTICLMEKANACVNAGSPGSVVWVNHFCGKHKHGFGWRDCHPSFAWTAIDVFSNHYPECLATMMVVDPPSIFFGLWRAVHPLLPEKTARKGMFVHSDDPGNPEAFEAMFGPELGAYLLLLIAADAK